VVEGIGGRFGLPPAYVRNQQICWLELTNKGAELVSARVELPGATRMERFVAHGRNPHSDRPVRVASWPAGPDWPPPEKKKDKKASRSEAVPGKPQESREAHGPREPQGPRDPRVPPAA
jgi:hypothetical protein